MVNKAYRVSSNKVLEELKSNKEYGLNKEEVLKRQEEYGLNKLPGSQHRSYFFIFLQQLNNAFLYLLMVAALLKYFLESYRDSAIIVVIIFINALIATIQEGKAQKILEGLQLFIETKCVVIRDNKHHIINEYELVPGDIIIVQEGARIPADARIIETSLLKIDESILTGESTGIEKQVDSITKENIPIYNQANMLFMGTHVISGVGKAVVVATGTMTEIGKIHKTVEHISTEMPLQKDLKKLSHIIMVASILVSCILFAIGIVLGKNIEEMFFTMTSLFVAIVPESIPAITTIVLAIGANRMARANVLIKRLMAIEALGRIDVLVVDKTGTLTRNEQMISKLYVGDKHYTVTGRGYHPEGKISYQDHEIEKVEEKTPLWYMGLAMTLLNQSELNYDESKKQFFLQGEPLHAAFGICAQKMGFDRITVQKTYNQINEIPFTSETRIYVACYELQGEVLMFVTGSPEIVMRHSNTINEDEKGAFAKMLEEGLRTIAVAYKIYPITHHTQEKENVSNLNFLGFVGMQDALRDNLKTTVDTVKHAGLKIIMATGDHKKTAQYVAQEANIFHEGDLILVGEDLQALSLQNLAHKLESATVLARVTPQEKLKIVNALHMRNHTVGMTGDGVNDAPALAAADIGIAMGTIGTEVAKEAADIVLLDDSLQSIEAGVTQGRHILATLHRVIFYLFTTSISELLIISIAVFMRAPLPLLATQILWENLVTDGFLDIGLSLEPAPSNILQGERVVSVFVTKKSFGKLLWMGSIMATGSLSIFLYYASSNLDLARTMTLTTLAMFQWFNAWNLRSQTESVFTMNPMNNPWLVGMTLSIITLHIFAIYNAFMQKALHIVPIAWYHWLVALTIASTILIAEETRKFFVRRTKRA